ncbi:MAG: NAD(P)/FAD-dependent oxidoreductase [Candidatus Kapaibacteriota bacterium]
MFDCIIIGAGIAGIVTARTMLEAGMNIAVIDDSWKSSASRVAAGLVNPITGKRFQISWRYDEFLALAKINYASFSKQDSESDYIKPCSMIRLFVDEKEVQTFHNKFDMLNPEHYVGQHFVPHSHDLHPSLRNEYGGFRTLQAYVFDYNRFLNISALVLGDKLISSHIEPDDISTNNGTWAVRTEKGVLHAKTILFCDGWLASKNSWLNHMQLQFDIVKGELCIIKSHDLPETDIISRGFAIMPIGDKKFRCAATFQWNDYTTIPTEFGSERLEQRIKSLITCKYEVLEQSAGIRPTMLHHKPFIGEHPHKRGLFAIGGLGTKGALYAPYMAQQFTSHFMNDTPFDKEMDIAEYVHQLTM